jgi:hypothetical protein
MLAMGRPHHWYHWIQVPGNFSDVIWCDVSNVSTISGG